MRQPGARNLVSSISTLECPVNDPLTDTLSDGVVRYIFARRKSRFHGEVIFVAQTSVCATLMA